MASEIEDHVKRISTHKGVKGMVILNNEGIPIRDTFDENSRSMAIQYAYLITNIVAKAKSAVKELDPQKQDELLFLRIRSRKHEILIAPERDYTLIAIQDPICS
eukprot:NODE_11103_length_418_cov_13.308943_g9981_i0.p2 GENE.NODE_11103_length_418_cov_13.308943_g9981_i0~~NODE_11103_length_418_cov_13.308943_g9981_i0.p2  ORF type:complete len:104 (-),score=26.46 NODE_11103_length_418_cov_13.308943_g9981_i0:38-349(-)